MSSPTVSIETPDGTFARALTDIAYVLAFAEQTEARIARALELLRQVVVCRHCAVLIDLTDRQLFVTVPASYAGADDLRVHLHELLQTVIGQPTGVEPRHFPQARSAGSWSLAVPLVSVDATVGVLHVGRDSKEYTVHELRLLSLVASQLAAYARGVQFLEQAEQTRTKAEEATRAKDRFLATLSHELRTPLNVIQGWLHMLRSRPGDEAATEKAIAVIERNVAVQVQLVDQLLDAARISTGKLHVDIQPMEILPVINATVDGVRPSATLKGVELEFVVPSSQAWRINGDAARLQQAFANLLVNGVKFTPAGGYVRVGVDQDGSHLTIAFRDTGMGIASEHLPRIFEPLWQADDALVSGASGLGLGLSIVRHIVQLHGGDVLVDSDGPGQGTAVTVRLPLIAPLPSSPHRFPE
jgi:signal transduction histidine kinase